jgi:hypothetical protein
MRRHNQLSLLMKFVIRRLVFHLIECERHQQDLLNALVRAFRLEPFFERVIAASFAAAADGQRWDAAIFGHIGIGAARL